MTAAPSYYMYDGDSEAGVVPARPSVDQLGGGKWINNPKYPPDPETMPYAEAFNQHHNVVAGLCRINGVLKISVTFAAGVPVITYFKTMGTRLLVTDLTVLDNAAGDTTITWPADSFPVRELNPEGLTINEDVAITESRCYTVTNGIRVKTFAGGVATDAAWTVAVHGQ